jgi:hypothetical protein
MLALGRFARWTYRDLMDLDLDEMAFWIQQAESLAERERAALERK